jgi:hypothetical protein
MALIFLLALYLRLAGSPDQSVLPDEIYHVLAGRSFLTGGNFDILDGSYVRGGLYTMLVSASFWLTGQHDIVSARLPAIILGALACPILLAWLWHESGRLSGIFAGGLLAVMDGPVKVSHFARFYTMQTLLILLAVILVHGAMKVCGSNRYHRLGVALVLLLIAQQAQKATIIVILCLGLFVAGITLKERGIRETLSDRRRLPIIIAGGISALVVAGALGAHFIPFLERTSLWAIRLKDDILFYERMFRNDIPLLWGLTPIAAIIALGFRPRLSFLCLLIFGIGFAVLSTGGMKSQRYLIYALPYLIAIWAMAVQAVAPAIVAYTRSTIAMLADRSGIRWGEPVRDALLISVLLAVFASAMMANRAVLKPLKHGVKKVPDLVSKPGRLFNPPLDLPWTGRSAALMAAIGHPSVFVTADDLRAILYLRPHDLLINSSRMSDIDPSAEFVHDPRTGRPVISKPESIAQVIACYPDGVILIPNDRWGEFYAVDAVTARRIQMLAQPIVPGVPGFHLFHWAHDADKSACARIGRAMAAG